MEKPTPAKQPGTSVTPERGLQDFWSTQRRGANYFNQSPSNEWFAAARAKGIEFARLAPDKWKSAQRDFLIGNADAFEEIPADDFDILKKALDDAHKNNIKIIITLLSLPGSRWKQNNDDKHDLRIWQNETYQKQAITFWKKLAELLKGHPAIVGYNILNEPHPELLSGIEDPQSLELEKWYSSIAGTSADLNLFYREIVQAIREVDPTIPLILDTGVYATPWAIRYLTPINDPRIMYAFHMYEPYAFTTRKVNNGRFTYPGVISSDASGEQSTHWDSDYITHYLDCISQWQKQHNIPSSRIVVGEFGCDRMAQGAAAYFEDLISLFNMHGWHWAFYSFREDSWDNTDYELGTGELDWRYWQAIENGENVDQFRKDNSLFNIIKAHLQSPTDN